MGAKSAIPAASIRGLKETVRAMQAAPREVKAAAFREFFEAGAQVVARARTLAPRSEGKRGRERRHLADSITTRVRTGGISVGSPLVYAMVVHFGRTVTQRSRSGSVYTRSFTPTAWLYPAIDAERDNVRARAQETVQRALDALFSAGGV